MNDKIEAFIKTMQPEHAEDDSFVSPRDAFKEIIQVIGNNMAEAWFPGKDIVECGSAEISETPNALYRLLYLTGATIDFSDMYKHRILTLASPDNRFVVMVEFYKYEIGLYFGCKRDLAGGPGSNVVGGFPGADNGVNCTDETGKAWFDAVKLALTSKWMVYGGNAFEV